MRDARRFRSLWLAGAAAAVLACNAAPAGAISSQTLSDPTGDNCRDYPMIGSHCGPDITQAVFSTPGDGNLHVDISYASLPLDGGVTQQSVEYVEVGIYPKAATTPSLFALPGTFRVSKTGLGWMLQTINAGFKIVANATATTRALGIDLAVPLANLGDPAAFRYAVNAGSTGETMPEHPDLAPNAGLFDLAGDAAAPAPTPTPTTTTTTPTVTPAPGPAPALRSLSSIPAVQRGSAIGGQIETTVAGDLTVEGFVPAAKLAAKSKLRSIGKITKRGVKAGKVSFRMALKSSARKKLAGRKTSVTLRLTLKPASGKPVVQSRKVSLTVPR